MAVSEEASKEPEEAPKEEGEGEKSDTEKIAAEEGEKKEEEAPAEEKEAETESKEPEEPKAEEPAKVSAVAKVCSLNVPRPVLQWPTSKRSKSMVERDSYGLTCMLVSVLYCRWNSCREGAL